MDGSRIADCGLRNRRRAAPTAACGFLCLAGLGCTSGLLKSHAAEPREAAHERWSKVRADVKRQLAESQFKAGHFDAALRHVSEALELQPKDHAALLLLARVHLECDHLPEARDAAAEAIRRAPADPEASYVAGLVAQRGEHWDDAQQHYAFASRAAPFDSDYLAAYVETLVFTDRTAEAAGVIEECLPAFADDVRLQCLAADVYRLLGMNDKAVGHMAAAARVCGQDPQILEAYGVLLSDAGRDVEATGVLSSLCEAPADDAEAPSESTTTARRIALAKSLYRLGKLEQARESVREALSRQPKHAAAWLLLARIALDLRDLPMAREAADAAVRYGAQRSEPHLISALVHLECHDPEAAALDAQAAIERSPLDSIAYCVLGRAHAAQGQVELATDAYGQALMVDPDCDVARTLLREDAAP